MRGNPGANRRGACGLSWRRQYVHGRETVDAGCARRRQLLHAELRRDHVQQGEVFAGAEVRLHDLDADRVATVKAFCERFVRSRGAAMSFVETPDLDRALAGADFVIVTFRVGGIKSLTLDETLPPRFGYFGNETVGPGGLFMAMRTVPVVLDVARRMKRLCPQAWLLNYANPTNFIGDALQRAGHRRWVALCDGYICPPRDIGVTVGLDYERVTTGMPESTTARGFTKPAATGAISWRRCAGWIPRPSKPISPR